MDSGIPQYAFMIWCIIIGLLMMSAYFISKETEDFNEINHTDS